MGYKTVVVHINSSSDTERRMRLAGQITRMANGHLVSARTPMDVNLAKQLNILIADMGMREFILTSSSNHVRVVSPMADTLRDLLTARGATVQSDGEASLSVTEMEAAQIGEIAAANRIVLHELSPQRASLEEAFIELTRDSVEYHAGGPEAAPAGAAAQGGSR